MLPPTLIRADPSGLAPIPQRPTPADGDSLLRLAIAAAARCDETGLHIARIGQLAGALSLAYDDDRSSASVLCHAAPLHDIGKIGVPDAVLKKAGPLLPEEWLVMRQHPEIGARILGGAPSTVFALAAEIALSHHENFDGSGYPAGLVGTAIPLSARVVSIVDYFDALTMDRVYRKRLPQEMVVDMMRLQRGSKFDPELVDVFIANIEGMSRLRRTVDAEFGGRAIDDAIFCPLF